MSTKRQNIFVLFTFQIICLVASRQVELPSACDENTDKNIQKGNAAFTGRFLYEAYKLNPNTNQIMSPFSIFVPIGELALYSKENTHTQLMQALNLRSKDEIKCAFQRLTRQFRSEKDVVLNMAARIFASDMNPLTKDFLEDTRTVFEAEAESISFVDPMAAADRINKWVESQTNQRIKDIATPDMFDETTRLVLANAIYFLGDWEHSFNNRSTEDRDFHVNSKTTIHIPTMQQTNYFKYAFVESLDCKLLEMNYKGNDFSFVVFLPNKVEGLAKMVEQLQDPKVLYSAYDKIYHREVDVLLPKIKIESEFDLTKMLSKIGITDIFSKRYSKLDNILQTYEPLYISAAKQKAFIEVEERGTEAAAANIFVAAVSITSVHAPPPPPELFHADHPFAFYIMYKRQIIFSGVFVK